MIYLTKIPSPPSQKTKKKTKIKAEKIKKIKNQVVPL